MPTRTATTRPRGHCPLNGNPSFWGGYAELGYYLTGETRGYKGGKFDRTKVLHPFNEGGWGAVQLNARVDYLNLTDRVDGSSTRLAAPFYVNGGKQIGYQLSAIWNPTDYVRFMAQYGHIDVTGGPRGSVATATTPGIFPIGTLTTPGRSPQIQHRYVRRARPGRFLRGSPIRLSVHRSPSARKAAPSSTWMRGTFLCRAWLAPINRLHEPTMADIGD